MRPSDVKPSDVKPGEWIREFREFQSIAPKEPPAFVRESLKRKILDSMEVSVWTIFVKLLGVHSVVGSITLLICNQFGFGLSGVANKVTDHLMKIHYFVCMSFCGALFVGLSVGAALFLLKPAEIRKFLETAILQVALISMLSLGAFHFVPGAVVTLAVSIPWIAGAVVSGYCVSRVGASMRKVQLAA